MIRIKSVRSEYELEVSKGASSHLSFYGGMPLI